MKCDRETPQRHWTRVGVHARASGLTLEAVLTKNDDINKWIRTGFEAAGESKSKLKRLNAQLNQKGTK